MDRLLRGEIPPGGKCDIKTLACEAGVDRTAFYGTRPCTDLRVEFERRLQALQQTGEIPDPREAHITRLKTENAKLRERLAVSEQAIDELTDFGPRLWPALPPNTRRSPAAEACRSGRVRAPTADPRVRHRIMQLTIRR